MFLPVYNITKMNQVTCITPWGHGLALNSMIKLPMLGAICMLSDAGNLTQPVLVLFGLAESSYLHHSNIIMPGTARVKFPVLCMFGLAL